MGDQIEDNEPAAIPLNTTKKRPIVWGLLSGWVLIFMPYLAVLGYQRHGFSFLIEEGVEWPYGLGILLLLPAVQGFVAGMVRRFRRPEDMHGQWVVMWLCIIDTIAATLFLREGVICLIMASPLLFAIVGIAFLVGRSVATWRSGTRVSVSLAPLVLLTVVGETAGPPPNQADVVSDSVVIHAPASYVWKYVVAYPENPASSDYWLWNLGLPMPVNSVVTEPKVGAYRECRFTGGQSYGERITELEPNRRLTYVVMRQMTHPEIAGHVSFDQGDIRLTQNVDGTTTMTMTGWYRLHVRPASYFELWSRDVARHIHLRVLSYTRALAERDYARDAANSRRDPT